MSSEVNQPKDKEEGSPPIPLWKRKRFMMPGIMVVAVLLACLARIHGWILGLAGAVALLGLVMMMLSVSWGIMISIFAHKWPRDCTQAALAGIAMVSFFVLVLVISNIFWRMDDVVLMAYPEKAIPVLEEYKQKHGAYPATLEEVPQLPPLPQGLIYYGKGKDFVFFRYYGGFFSGSSYTNEQPRWKWTDD